MKYRSPGVVVSYFIFYTQLRFSISFLEVENIFFISNLKFFVKKEKKKNERN